MRRTCSALSRLHIRPMTVRVLPVPVTMARSQRKRGEAGLPSQERPASLRPRQMAAEGQPASARPITSFWMSLAPS